MANTIRNSNLENEMVAKAKGFIEEYCRREFEDEKSVDFSDLSKIPVAYTTTEDEEHEIQAYINLEDFRIETFVDDKCVRTEQYDSFEEMIEDVLPYLCFDELVCVSDEELSLLGSSLNKILEDATIRSKAGCETELSELFEGLEQF